MLTLAICDDDTRHRAIVVKLLKDYLVGQPDTDLKITVFPSGGALLLSEDPAAFDLYLLDVLMPAPNGIETGLALRRQGAKGVIIYLTTSREYAVESYDAQAFSYLIKPVEKVRFFEVMDQAVAMAEHNRTLSFLIQTKEGGKRIEHSRILYVEKAGRSLRCHCSDGSCLNSISLRGSFKAAVVPLLQDRAFLLCGASLVINLHHVQAVEGSDALFDTDERLPLPRRSVPDTRRAWMDYWLADPTHPL